MGKKLLLQDIADILSAREDFPLKTVEVFCRLFFEVIDEGLQRDKFVKIKGFGTFKLVPVGERESVDVNTGERIQIGSHTKVTFSPDTFIRETVNKPFAHFDTIILNAETLPEELDEANDLVREMIGENQEDQTSSFLAIPPSSCESADLNNKVTLAKSSQTNAIGQEIISQPDEQVQKGKEGTPDNSSNQTVSPSCHNNDGLTFADVPITTDGKTSSAMSVSSSPLSADATLPGKALSYDGMASDGSERLKAETKIAVGPQLQEDSVVIDTKEKGAGMMVSTEQSDASSNNSNGIVNDEKPTSRRDVTPSSMSANAVTVDEKVHSNDEDADSGDDTCADNVSPTVNVTTAHADRVSYVVENTPRRLGPNWWRIIAITLFVLIFIVISYFVGYYRMLCPPCDFLSSLIGGGGTERVTSSSQLIHSFPPKTVPPRSGSVTKMSNSDSDTLKRVSTSQKMLEAKKVTLPTAKYKLGVENNKRFDPNKNYRIIGTMSVYRVKRGENLYAIAARFYGSKYFVNYIIRHNKLRNPDSIVAEERLMLPRLEPKE